MIHIYIGGHFSSPIACKQKIVGDGPVRPVNQEETMSKKQLQEFVILLLDVIAKYPFIVLDKVLLKHLEQVLPSKNKQSKNVGDGPVRPEKQNVGDGPVHPEKQKEITNG